MIDLTGLSFADQRCLVTGGAGFIGSNLTRALLAAGAHVTVLDNFTTGQPGRLPLDARLVVLDDDLRTTPGLDDLLAQSDYVFHLAAQVGNVKSIEDPQGDASANVMGSVRLLDRARHHPLRKVVYSSSSAIFGEAETLPIAEDHRQQPASFYALSKLTAERYALLAHELGGVPAVCLRYFNVFGLPMEQNEYTGVISIFFNRLAAGQGLTIFGDGEQVRDFVSVDDVVQANLRAALRGREGRVYNIGTGVPTSVTSLARTMMRVVGREVDLTYLDARAGEVRQSLAAIDRAREELGYAPGVSLEAGLGDMFARLVRGGVLPGGRVHRGRAGRAAARRRLGRPA